jgi:hypothetical protein
MLPWKFYTDIILNSYCETSMKIAYNPLLFQLQAFNLSLEHISMFVASLIQPFSTETPTRPSKDLCSQPQEISNIEEFKCYNQFILTKPL